MGTYLGMNMNIYEVEQSIQIMDQAWKLIHK